MANTVLTPNMILRESYAIMHQRSNFIMRTNRQYDGRFANKGAQIGQSLDIRLPAKYSTRTGNVMSAQNHVERSVALPLATVKGVDFNFGQEELSYSIELFSERILQPAMSQLIADVEADAFSMYKQVANYVGIVTTTAGSLLNYLQFQNTGRFLTENLAPRDGNRTACLNPESNVKFSDAVKGLFQSAEAIKQQYVDGVVGRTGGYNVYENTIVPAHTTGLVTTTGAAVLITTTAGAPGYDSLGTGNAYSASGSIKMDGGTISFKAGDIFTIANVNEVHPETKQDLGYAKRFVVLADVAASATPTVTYRPAIITGGAYQNVSAAAANNAAVTRVGAVNGGGAITYGQNLMFHRDAFIFVTADLEDASQYGAWGAREVFDGLSIRIWKQGDIANGSFPTRIDICYGYVAPYPEWACRHVHLRNAP